MTGRRLIERESGLGAHRFFDRRDLLKTDADRVL
jgi:hypothetical protein